MYLKNTDWLFTLRRISLDAAPVPADSGRIPFEDIFMWPNSYGMTGVHVSAGGASDDWLALSLYQESSCKVRFDGPLANEIVMVSTWGKTEYDKNKHVLTKNGTIRRVGHHFSYPEDCSGSQPYWGQPRASLSMDGKYVVYTSTFGRTGRTDVFVLTLPKLP